MAHSISVDALATGLNQYVVRFGQQLHSIMRQGLEFETMLPFRQTDSTYTGQEGSVNQVIQPWQKDFSPTNAETFDGIFSELRPIKSDLTFNVGELEKFFSKWNPGWFTPDPTQTQTGYAARVITDLILPKALEEINLASWAGEYVTPAVPGTAGAVLESVDGFRKGIADQITAGRLTPITTGAFTATVAQVRAFCDDIPEPYRYKSGKIFMSKTHAQAYADDYQTQYPTRTVVEDTPDRMYARVDHYNKTIVGVTAMEGSDRIICVFDNMDSMIIGTRTGYPLLLNYRFEAEDRNLKAFAEIYRFYSFETCLHMFVNEQV